MFPDINKAPQLPYEAAGPEHLFYDLTYNPVITRFLQNGLDRGAVIKNGYDMLVHQAEASWKIWNA
jgi:shikimate dehydrogenase